MGIVGKARYAKRLAALHVERKPFIGQIRIGMPFDLVGDDGLPSLGVTDAHDLDSVGVEFLFPECVAVRLPDPSAIK